MAAPAAAAAAAALAAAAAAAVGTDLRARLVAAAAEPDARRRSGELTTLVTGTASFEEMTEFIGHLQPVTS